MKPSARHGDRLRVCLVANARFPIREPFVGGLEAMTWHLARELLRRGHEVAVFAAPGSDPALGVEELSLGPPPSNLRGRLDLDPPANVETSETHAYEAVVDLLVRDGARFDVVHNNSLNPVVLRRASELGAPLLTTLHTPPLEPITRTLAPSGGHGSFVAVSTFTATAWSPHVTTGCVPNGVDTSVWRPGPGGTHAVWTGRLVPEKAPHEAIDAARLAGVPLVLAGPVLDRRYYSSTVEPRLGDDVTYAGHLDRHALAALVGHSSVALVTPAWDEPYGLVAAEALACGTPVAAYDRGGLREVVGEHGCFAPPDDTGSLATAVRGAMMCGRGAARAHAVQHLSVERMVDLYEALYRSLAVPPVAA